MQKANDEMKVWDPRKSTYAHTYQKDKKRAREREKECGKKKKKQFKDGKSVQEENFVCHF